MSGRYFLDTNILVYTFDSANPSKQARARDLVSQALRDSRGVISYQVIQEFLNVATRKFAEPLSPEDCARYLDTVMLPLCHVYPSGELFRQALEIHATWKFSYFDSLIVAGAMAGGCERIYSENLQHGQQVRDLLIENPFQR